MSTPEIRRHVEDFGRVSNLFFAYGQPAFSIPGSAGVSLAPHKIGTQEERMERLIGRVIGIDPDSQFVTIAVMSDLEKSILFST
jgi:hypothetical protein